MPRSFHEDTLPFEDKGMPDNVSRQERNRVLSGVSHGGCFASIDLGSHTVRLLIARRDNLEIVPLRVERRITRLAEDFGTQDRLGKKGMHETLAAMEEYVRLMHRYEVESVSCGATGVVRRARNQSDFLDQVRRRTGLSPAVLSEDFEALLSAKGTLSALPSRAGLTLLFDLGGSSTEFLLLDSVHPDAPLFVTSVFVGAATLTERFLACDPPSASSLAAAAAAAAGSIAPVISAVAPHLAATRPDRPFLLAGTAGTVTTLAAMYLRMEPYEPFRVNGLALSYAWISEMIASLASSTLAQRVGIRGLEKGREDIILGGAVIVGEIVRGFNVDTLTAADAGLLEGLLLDLVEKSCGIRSTLVSPLTWRPQKE